MSHDRTGFRIGEGLGHAASFPFLDGFGADSFESLKSPGGEVTFPGICSMERVPCQSKYWEVSVGS